MKLNPEKCTFGVQSGKFLGYLVSKRGIEANPSQIKAVLDIPSPKCVKDVQLLTGKIVALTRFISKSSERCQPFFDILKKNKEFVWNDVAEKALQDLKEYLTSPPLLSKPSPGETLYLYLSVASNAVSSVLVREEDRRQSPVYYVSRALLDTETRYSMMEKLALALVTSSKKLRPYFQCHPIVVVSNYPLRNVLHKPDLSGRFGEMGD